MNQSIVQVRALTRELLPDFLKFFDGTAFSDNPKWSSCYCQRFYEDHRMVKWSQRAALENRARVCERIEGGLMQGYLAYLDGAPVGWSNAAPRKLLHACWKFIATPARSRTGRYSGVARTVRSRPVES